MFARLGQQLSRSTTAMVPMVPKFLPQQPSFMMMRPPMMIVTQPIQQFQLFTMTQRLMATSRTYQPSVRRRKAVHGFLRRLKTRGGRRVVIRRKEKGRWKVGV